MAGTRRPVALWEAAVTREKLQSELEKTMFQERAKKAARDLQERLFEAARTRLHLINADLMKLHSKKLQLQAALESRGKAHKKAYNEAGE